MPVALTYPGVDVEEMSSGVRSITGNIACTADILLGMSDVATMSFQTAAMAPNATKSMIWPVVGLPVLGHSRKVRRGPPVHLRSDRGQTPAMAQSARQPYIPPMVHHPEHWPTRLFDTGAGRDGLIIVTLSRASRMPEAR
jgi:hypothetical protein